MQTVWITKLRTHRTPIFFFFDTFSKNKTRTMPSRAIASSLLMDTMDSSATSLIDCFDPKQHRINKRKYLLQTCFAEEDNEELELLKFEEVKATCKSNKGPPKTRRRRITLARRTEEGKLEAIPPTDSLWWHIYIDCPQHENPKFLTKFRRRFRIPYKQFLWLVDEAIKEKWFPRWMSKDAAGKDAKPLQLLILGALRYLGRGLTFDDLEECTAISEELHRQFFHVFIHVGSTILYNRYVKSPQTSSKVEQHMHEFTHAGMPGAFASMDATHIVHERCKWKYKRAHIGHKSKHATRTYNLMVNHRRRILASTKGHPGSFNDKTLIMFDKFVHDIIDGKLDDYTFELLEQHGTEIVPVKYRGVWIIVDNGYHNWSITVPPIPSSDYRKEIRWSEWIESMRKDVECTFGILKGRWRILKTGIRLHSIECVDRIWLTCCAFHNMLLEIDGLDQQWDGIRNTTSEWEGELGNLAPEDIPFAIRRINDPSLLREYDSSSIGVANQRKRNVPATRVASNSDLREGQIRNVRDLSMNNFRSKLINHFEIKFRMNEIEWPKWRGNIPTTNV